MRIYKPVVYTLIVANGVIIAERLHGDRVKDETHPNEYHSPYAIGKAAIQMQTSTS